MAKFTDMNDAMTNHEHPGFGRTTVAHCNPLGKALLKELNEPIRPDGNVMLTLQFNTQANGHPVLITNTAGPDKDTHNALVWLDHHLGCELTPDTFEWAYAQVKRQAPELFQSSPLLSSQLKTYELLRQARTLDLEQATPIQRVTAAYVDYVQKNHPERFSVLA
ncbi:MAG: hypothetical protein SFZ03_00135 [Candidatus Melainabacteria bacterium]|nr:hypothetical protein [Candidatus Melainabacteria bacterium]